jgi:hypothetical protein
VLLLSGPRGNSNKLFAVLKKFDFEGLLDLNAGDREGAAGLHVMVRGRTYEGTSALYMILVYNPLTYFVFALLLAASYQNGLFLRAGGIMFLLFVSPALLVLPLLRRSPISDAVLRR